MAGLSGEVDVQNWFANERRKMQGRCHMLGCEPHVADEKEPDIRPQSRIADARMPIEIKIAGSRALEELEAASSMQLRNRYLRDRDNRFGILPIVHRKARSRGWKSAGGFLACDQVIIHLRRIAAEMGAADALAPQMAICSVDISRPGKPDMATD